MDIQNLIGVLALGQLSLLITWLAAKQTSSRTHLTTLALLISVAGYLLVSNSVFDDILGAARPAFLLLALLPPYLLWLFAVEIFEIGYLRRPARYWVLLLPVTIFTGSTLIQAGTWLLAAHQVLSLVLITQVLVAIMLEYKDDLVARRRQFRLWFVGLISLHTGTILIVELIYTGANVPEALQIMNACAISLLILLLSVPLTRIDRELLWHPARQVLASKAGPVRPADAESSAEDHTTNPLIVALSTAMDQGFFKTSGLTIRQLADHLGTTEHQLRATINQQLGHRNFNAFLNGYRIDAAKTALADTTQAHKPVLTIALELGYQSIGPFNRAFKAATGTTPTQYRQSNLK